MTDEPRGPTEFWTDLRRHPAFQAALLFGGGSWLALQAGDIFGLETSTLRLLGATAISTFLMLALAAALLVMRRRAGGLEARQGLSVRMVAAGAALLLMLGTGAWAARPYLLGSAVKAGADVIVVLPFQASGPGVELLGEGLVDLLSTNLDEVGAIRTVNPRTTLHQYRQHAVNGSIDLDGALRVGRAVGAGSVLLGSVVAAGSEARVTAELHAVGDGRVIARAQKSGAADNVLGLVDELSVELMRDIWRSREPLPQLRVSAITTPSVPAIRAYMRGEQFYRRVQWDSARVAFLEAVAHDSTFALAHFRLAETFGWSESIGSAESRRHSSAAARFADRLPARERALVLAHEKHEEGDVAAIRAFEEYTARYPDDVTGWYMLADARFHAATALGLALPELLEGFERAHGMDPTYAQPYAHMLEVSFMLEDSARYDRHLARFATVVDDDATQIYRTLRVVRWGARADALRAIEEATAGGAVSMGVFERLAIGATMRAYAAPVDIEFFIETTQLMRRALPQVPGVEESMRGMRAAALASVGRFREADAELQPLRSLPSEHALGAVLPFIATGAAPEWAFGAERERLARSPARRGAAFWRSVQALAAGDAMTAAREIEVVRRDTLPGLELPHMAVDALGAWLDVVRGDTAGVARLSAAVVGGGYAPMNRSPMTPVRLQLALLQAERAATRVEAINRLEGMARMEPNFAPLVYVPLAEAYAAQGDAAQAAFWYARFIDAWRNADPELQDRVESAQLALGRLRTG